MKVTVDIKAEGCEWESADSNLSGIVVFDEFGVAKKININSCRLDATDDIKRDAKNIMRSVAERVRAEILDQNMRSK